MMGLAIFVLAASALFLGIILAGSIKLSTWLATRPSDVQFLFSVIGIVGLNAANLLQAATVFSANEMFFEIGLAVVTIGVVSFVRRSWALSASVAYLGFAVCDVVHAGLHAGLANPWFSYLAVASAVPMSYSLFRLSGRNSSRSRDS